MWRVIWMVCLCLLPLISKAEPVTLTGLLFKPAATHSTFTFILNGKTYGKVKYLPKPNRVIVELENTQSHFYIKPSLFSHANVKSLRAENMTGGLRFTFLTNTYVKPTIQFLPTANPQTVRLALDISNALVAPNVAVSRPLKTPVGIVASNKGSILHRAVEAFHAIKFPEKSPVFIVAIDAGHGGKDSGAIGANGVLEKNIVLAIAKKLQTKINQQPNMRAVLTRDGDYFVPLRERMRYARKDKADIFVAIHADAYFNRLANGVSVYALSQRGATSEAARWLAHRDNYSQLGQVALNDLPDRDPIIRSVLVDLAQTATIQDSIKLGSKILDAMDDVSNLHYRHVERAPFMVLKSPDIPSILVETGYISNVAEERRLNDPAYQRKIADSLLAGINLYIKQYK